MRDYRSDTDSLIEARQAFASAGSDAERRDITDGLERRTGITNVNDKRHAQWYAEQRGDSWAPKASETRRPLSADEEYERLLERTIASVNASDSFDDGEF